MIGKIVNGKLVFPPTNDGNKLNVYKNPEWLKDHGFHELTQEELASIKHEPKAIKLSKLSIIEALGEEWPVWKALIQEAGAWDYWEACTYIETTNPRFKPFLRKMSPEQRKMLMTQCRY